MFDFRGMRLDWFRLQAYTSVSKASLGIADHKELGKMMNTIIFHTKMVDSLVEMLVETSDLSIFWYLTCSTRRRRREPRVRRRPGADVSLFFVVQLLQPRLREDVPAVFGASFPEPTLHLLPAALHALHVLHARALSRRGKPPCRRRRSPFAPESSFAAISSVSLAELIIYSLISPPAPPHRGPQSVLVQHVPG